MNNTDGNLAALAVYEKEQDALAQLEDFIAKRVNEMEKEIKSGDFDPYRLNELREIHFDNNGEVDDLFRNLLISNSEINLALDEALKISSVNDFADNFFQCVRVEAQIQEWAEEDLTQEAEDNRNESACEARDCD